MYVRSSKNLEITPFLKDEPSSVHSDSLSLFEVCLQFGLQIRLQKGRDHPGLRCLKFQPLIGNLQTHLGKLIVDFVGKSFNPS